MKKQVIRELVVWMVIFLVAWIVCYPIYRLIPYVYLPHHLISIVLLLHFARWFVLYDQVLIFKNPYAKVVFCCALFFISFVLWSEGQKIVALVENMELKDIMPENATPVFLTFDETFQLFNYIRNVLVVCNYGTPGIAFVLTLKIIYKTLGMGRNGN